MGGTLFLGFSAIQKGKDNGRQGGSDQNPGHHVMPGHCQPIGGDYSPGSKYESARLPQVFKADGGRHRSPLHVAGVFTLLFGHLEDAFCAAGNHGIKPRQLVW